MIKNGMSDSAHQALFLICFIASVLRRFLSLSDLVEYQNNFLKEVIHERCLFGRYNS